MPHVLLDRSLTDVYAQLEQFATNTFRPPQSIVPCHLLDQRHGLSGYLRFGCSRPRFVLPEKSKSLAMPLEQRLWLDNEQGVFPGLNCLARRTRSIRSVLVQAGRFTCRRRMISCCRSRAFSAMSSDLLLARSVSVQSRERGGVRFCPGDEAVVERPKTIYCQPCDEGENPVHSRRYPFVKMSESMLEMVV